MNREQAEQLVQELTTMLPASILFYADNDELVDQHGVDQKYIDAINWLEENNEEMLPSLEEASQNILNGSKATRT